MIITILTLFPEVFVDIFSSSIIGRAQKKGLVTIRTINIRNFATDAHKSVDDKPYGGGVGMLMRVDIVERAITSSKWAPSGQIQNSKFAERTVLLNPAGKLFTQAKARQFSKLDHLILVCGHYEGIDTRINHFVDESISIGKYILTGGEIPAMVITDAVVRLTPKVLKKKLAIINESFTQAGIIESPQYTRPEVFKGYKVPKILLSGNHLAIAKWRTQQSFLRSHKRGNNIRNLS